MIGVVTGALGLRWYDVVVTGQDAHAGPTPMRLRKDACSPPQDRRRGQPLAYRSPACRPRHGRIHAGQAQFRNVVPGEVRLSVDLRHAERPELDAMEAECAPPARGSDERGSVSIDIKCVTDYPP